MNPNTRIIKISLTNFKNHLNTSLTDLAPFVALNGINGSGKTNILEAISLFAPGRGIKNSSFLEIPNKLSKEKSFEIKINVKYESGEIELIRTFSAEEKKKWPQQTISSLLSTVSCCSLDWLTVVALVKNSEFRRARLALGGRLWLASAPQGFFLDSCLLCRRQPIRGCQARQCCGG